VMFKDSINGLMDISPRTEFIESVRKTVAITPGVKGVPKISARKLGRNVWVDLEIKVTRDTPLKEGTRIKDEVKALLFRRFKNLADIQIHLEPYRPL
jgi:divalent metal cation (Fe/Co/Zn/Cd) transporter